MSPHPPRLTSLCPSVQFRLAQEAGPETFAQHRDTWITKRELQEMKDLNVNCIRLPFGYWVLDVPELVRKPAGPHHPARPHPATPLYECDPRLARRHATLPTPPHPSQGLMRVSERGSVARGRTTVLRRTTSPACSTTAARWASQ